MTAPFPEPDSELAEAGRLWAIRARDRAFKEWDGLTAWLEAGPAHLDAYEAAVAQDEWLDGLLAGDRDGSTGGNTGGNSSRNASGGAGPVPQAEAAAANDDGHGRGRWPHLRRMLGPAWGGAVAAAIAAVAGWVVLQGNAQEIATAPGEHRTVALADGSRITLNGGTQISFDPDKPRVITLARGEALFDVRHKAGDPFVVMAGGTRLLDVGTVFNVVSEGNAVDVAVAEGEVIYDPESAAIRLVAGDALARQGSGAKPVLRKTRPQAVGAWRAGRLEYDNASLDEVARDLSRNLGRAIRVTPGTGQLRFSGTLVVDGAQRDVLSRAGPLLGVRFAPDGDAWRMTPANAAQP